MTTVQFRFIKVDVSNNNNMLSFAFGRYSSCVII